VATIDSLDALPALRLRIDARRVVTGVTGVAVLAAAVLLAGTPTEIVSEAAERIAGADPLLVAVGVVAEVGSFVGYAALTAFVVGRATPRVDTVVSAQITLAGTAVNRLLPTAGLGGIGLTLWALRRAGLSAKRASSTLLTFLVLLYAVFLTGLTLAGLGAIAGDAGSAPAWAGIAPAGFGLAAIAIAAGLGLVGPGRLSGAGRGGRRRRAVVSLATSVREATALLRTADLRLAGGLAWWGLDLTVLVMSFAALGHPPALGVIALGYFAGIVANTIPIPGAVAGGMTGVLVLSGVPAGFALPAVFTYRAISLWIPVPVGGAALVALRRTVRRWTEDDARQVAHSADGQATGGDRCKVRPVVVTRPSPCGAARPAAGARQRASGTVAGSRR
jgi:uncharacterized membrane protein YbhN (UPF0104 family)